ncbi:hypothetical protein WH158_10065, partial [Gluconobacter cerinus]
IIPNQLRGNGITEQTSIPGGFSNPPRVIKYRFSEEVIEQLLEIAWWNWPEDVIRTRMKLLMNDDIEEFLRAFKV